MKVLLSTGELIELPNQYNMQERMEFVEELVRKYPNEFGLKEDGTSFINGLHSKGVSSTSNTKVNTTGYQAYQRSYQVERQYLIVEYILQLDDSYGQECLSFYKRTKRSKKELSSNGMEFTKSKITKTKSYNPLENIKTVGAISICL